MVKAANASFCRDELDPAEVRSRERSAAGSQTIRS
jgi:hypothetical protein